MAYMYKLGTATLAIAAVIASPAFAQDDTAGESPDSTAMQSAEKTVSEVQAGEVSTVTSQVSPFYGRIDPFYGDIGAFWDDISPFYGRIDPFYGTINPFWDDISPFYGNIGAFWGDIDAFYGNIGAFNAAHLAGIGDFWTDTSVLFRDTEATWSSFNANASDPQQSAALSAQLVAQLNDLVARSNAQWGTAVTLSTGQSFNTAFVAPILARHGIDLSNPASLAALSDSQRAAFFLDWHDSLMAYSGLDHVDHWMGMVNWTPAITQIQGSTGQSVIGILDSTITNSSDLADNVVFVTGGNGFVSGHGAGVASLMIGAHDGEGVMGIAPNARVVAHNPFDATGTASWADVQHGISQLQNGGASIINLSLGEAGTPLAADWRDIFASAGAQPHAGNTVYVLAAGNDGVAQSNDIEWSGAFGTSFLLVGSVSPDGTISSFSNTPGTACLLDNGVCGANGQLMNRFIVAPGELMLVDDGYGNLVRRSGTSFSAPLVSGAIALLHDRWPWLANHSAETAEIILRSARDLGAPGVDEVYGVGMLDVMASQSPLNFNNMQFTIYQRKRFSWRESNHAASTIIGWGVPDWWETNDVFFAMYEDIGNTYRDFAVPMSSYTRGKRTNVLGGGYKRLQDFVGDRFARWILSGGTDSNGDGVAGVTQIYTGAERPAGSWALQYSAAMPQWAEDGSLDPVHAAAALTDPSGKFAFTLGYGHGAMALSGDRFGVISDFDREDGGANPVLGFASGEFFTSASMAISNDTTMRLGYSENRLDWDETGLVDPLARLIQSELGSHEAHAFTADIEQRLTGGVSLNLQYTRMRENEALLGAQTDGEGLLSEGAVTEAITLSGTVDLGARTRLDLSATASDTELAEGQWLSNENGVYGTAAQIALTRQGVLSRQDSMRVTFGQPLNVEQGTLQLHTLGVIDRQTGERGVVTQEIGVETKRRVMGELVYATPVVEGGELGLFGRYVTEGVKSEGDSLMLGANFGLRF